MAFNSFFKYLRTLIRANSLESSKSFAMVTSVLVGSLVGLVVCFCLVWDVLKNGYIKTDLESLGIFLLCAGGFMAGGGINKAVAEYRERKNNKDDKRDPDGKDKR